MRFEDFNWMDIEAYLKTDDRIMLVVGSCEQHGYLSLLTATKIPLVLADLASKETNVLIAPPLNFGVSTYFEQYPGTISLKIDTLIQVISDVVHSLYKTGFRRILILNGQGGNDPAKARLYELANELPGLKMIWYSWWQSHSIESVSMKHEMKSYHAGWIEAFPFVKVCDLPDGEKTPPSYQGILSDVEMKEVMGDGVFGGLYEASPEMMNEVLSAALLDVIQYLEF